jgi:hypothetical protein
MILPGAINETLIIQSHYGHVEECVQSVPGEILFHMIYTYTCKVYNCDSKDKVVLLDHLDRVAVNQWGEPLHIGSKQVLLQDLLEI